MPSEARYIIGYTADERGAEALRLGARLAGTDGSTELDLVIGLPEHTPFEAVYKGAGSYSSDSILGDTVRKWAEDALAMVPEGIPATVLARSGPSEAEVLMDVAKERGALLIVVGAHRRGIAGRFTVGSVASALLHSSPVPLALAPAAPEAEAAPSGGLSRVTAFIGTRPGAKAVVVTAASAAARRGCPLRLVSLIPMELDDQAAIAEATAAAMAGLDAVVAETGVEADVVVAHGSDIEAAVEGLDWRPDETAVVGSSRLGRKRRIFLGATAHRMLRSLPVPLIVVPRDYQPGTAP
jgi:nucleotide-binding universal stress UspA family protein